MKIYLIRHSNAIEPVILDEEDDNQRPLTEKGSEKMRKIASGLRKMKVIPDLIVSSPYVRARQTAEILAKELKHKPDLVFSEALIPLGSAENLVGEINEKYSVDELFLVGHEPNLSRFAGALIADNPEINLTIKNGGICCLAVDDLHTSHAAVLEWLLPPKFLLAL